MEPVPFFRLKCVLGALGSMLLQVAVAKEFTIQTCAAILGAGTGWLLAYLLKITEPKQ